MIRVRYAPSPTGFQHIGGVRTALFNYLFARVNGGQFVLRIEDTDRERYNDEALQDIYDTFDWLGFHWDEGPDVDGPYSPYRQSERFQLYQTYAAQLAEAGHAYPCYCSPERLQKLRAGQEGGKQFGYDRHCRDLTPAQREKASGRPVVRFKVPLEGKTGFKDILLGNVERENSDINPDPVLLKSDGYPTYHLANVVDDHLMEITHILRAQEWLPSVSLHVLIYSALGWNPPQFCHLPMVLGPDGQKLSKRHGADRIVEFRQKGYLPEAIINYIALLGWSFDDSQEFFSLEDLAELFTLDRLNKAPGVFDYKKLDWFNGMYIRKTEAAVLKNSLLPILQESGLVGESPTEEEQKILDLSIPLVQERLTLLNDISGLVGFLFQEAQEFTPMELIPKRLDQSKTLEVLQASVPLLESYFDRSEEENERMFRSLADTHGVKLGDLLMPLRVAVTGSRVSPPLFGILNILGKKKTLTRVQRATELLES